MEVYKKLLHYVPKERYLAYIAILLTTVSAVVNVAAYFYMYLFFKELIVQNSLGDAFSFAVIVISLLLGSGLLYFAAVLLTHVLGFRLETNLRKKGIDGLMSSSFKFFDVNSSGRTRKIIDDNAAQTHNIVAHLIPDNSGAVLTPILVLVLGFLVDIKLGIALVIFTALGILQVFYMMGGNTFMDKYQASLERMNSETVEYIRGVQVIKIFGTGVDSFKNLYNAIQDYSKYALEYSMGCKGGYLRFQVIFMASTAILAPMIVLFLDLSSNPKLLATNLIMFLFLSGVLFTNLMRIMYVSMYSFLGKSAVEKLEKIFDDMQKDKLEFGQEKNVSSYDIEFDNVSFAYGEEPVLTNLSFKLDANKIYALVGASGSGKSTIAKLISGFYKVNNGEIKIGGKNISSYSEETVTKMISFVFQESKLFKLSIFDNVKLGNPDATDEAVFEAMKLAGCDKILEKFPDRECTLIGSKGVFLSGGEKQRIAIARAILKDANIIILDESSAAIDPDNEHEMQKAFKNLMKNKTVIMIAHRLSSISSVDEILVLENGNIIERGSEKELMQMKGRYKYFFDIYMEANDWKVQ